MEILALLPAEILTMLLHLNTLDQWRICGEGLTEGCGEGGALKQFPATDKEYSLLSNHCLHYTLWRLKVFMFL